MMGTAGGGLVDVESCSRCLYEVYVYRVASSYLSKDANESSSRLNKEGMNWVTMGSLNIPIYTLTTRKPAPHPPIDLDIIKTSRDRSAKPSS
jgi:hypothetical protein